MSEQAINPMQVQLNNGDDFEKGTVIIDPPTIADYTTFESNAIKHLTKMIPAEIAPERPSNRTHPLVIEDSLGEVTSDVVANVYAYQYAIFEGVMVFLNIAGPRAGIESIRAKFSKGEDCHLHTDMQRAPVPLRTGKDEDGEPATGMYTTFQKFNPAKRIYNAIITHKDMVIDTASQSGAKYIFHTSDEQAMYTLKVILENLTGLPLYNQWLPYLWQAGRISMNVRECRQDGGVKIYGVMQDADSWKRLISGGIANKIINLPTITN